MRKVFKIILAVFAVIIILVAAFGAIVFLDLAAYTATGSKTLTPTGTSTGKALVVYDPGLSGAAKGVADKIASDLQAKGYTVTLAGIKSSAAITHFRLLNNSRGRTNLRRLTNRQLKDYLNNLKPDQGAKVGVFGSGSGATTPSDVSMLKNSVSALGSNGSLQTPSW